MLKDRNFSEKFFDSGFNDVCQHCGAVLEESCDDLACPVCGLPPFDVFDDDDDLDLDLDDDDLDW